MRIKKDSPWLTNWKDISFPKLDKDISSDITIIGGGITGLLSAYLLMKEGKEVTLIEKEAFISGATAYTTALLTSLIDTAVSDLETSLGKEKAKRILSSHESAIDLIESIVKKEKIDCEFMRCPQVVYANSSEFEIIADEGKLLRDYGYAVSIDQNSTLPFPNSGSLTLANQAKFHPMKFILGLLAVLKEHKVAIYTHTEAEKIEENDEEIYIKTTGGTITTNNVLIATYDPFNQPIQLFAHKGMYTSYVYELSVSSGIIPEGIYQDMYNPYHYFRVDSGKDEDRIIVGGDDHRHEIPMNPEKNFRSLAMYIEKLFKDIPYIITRKWSGPILEPADGLAYIGTFSKDPRKFVALAFSGNGMTYAAITAMMYKDHILGKKSLWEDVYQPTRVPTLSQLLQKGKDYTEEFVQGAVKNIFK